MYGDVNTSIEDGNLSSSNNKGTGIHVKIGISAVSSDTPVCIKSSMTKDKIAERFGDSPLTDACLDSIEYGAKTIYCIPVTASVNGMISEVAMTGESVGKVTVSGNAINAYDVVIEVIESGNTNVGTIKYSVDGGNSYSDEVTIPLSGKIVLGSTGLSVTFEDEEENESSFVEGTKYNFSVTAPAMSNEAVINAVESLRTFTEAFEFIHIVGITSSATWASLAALADKFCLNYKKPLFFVCESRNKGIDEEYTSYMVSMEDSSKIIKNYSIEVVSSYATYVRTDGRIQDINLAGIICGMYCNARESQSIGEVKSFFIPSSKLLKLLPEGIEDYTEQMDALRYTTIRQYYGKEDYYVTSANMMCPDGSDYRYAEDVRVLNRIVRQVRLQALNELQTEIDPNDIESSVATLKEELSIPIDDAIEDGIISSGKVEIDTENVNILESEELDVQVTYVPMGHLRSINIKFGVENPYS